ncbi:MAG TPA: hypothetical protein VHB99_11940 [Pirellulales bacterium]|nr:hypothetical protein [Pirellulales bacterium]
MRRETLAGSIRCGARPKKTAAPAPAAKPGLMTQALSQQTLKATSIPRFAFFARFAHLLLDDGLRGKYLIISHFDTGLAPYLLYLFKRWRFNSKV